MSQFVRRGSEAQQERIKVRRNPYLQDYEEHKRFQEIAEGKFTTPRQRSRSEYARRAEAVERPETDQFQRDRVRASAARRRRIVRRQRMAMGIWCLCMLALLVVFLLGKSAASASEGRERRSSKRNMEASGSAVQESMIQGLPQMVYSSHPHWTENFLTPNEYSRPGDPLEKIDNIFVHYTANPGTSAAQNRSYFEQQKDVHERSVSAHFIIGYDGEIIQCVPLDEIAYAVMTRNEDSISIECCYLEADGSFTQETYDSLISLLAWLAEAYDLEADDILRHYDCGGKKCPLYYTDHPDEWEQLKRDVEVAMEDSRVML